MRKELIDPMPVQKTMQLAPLTQKKLAEETFTRENEQNSQRSETSHPGPVEKHEDQKGKETELTRRNC